MTHISGNCEAKGGLPPGWLSEALSEHADMAYRICLRTTGDREDAFDAFQNACLGLVRRADEFRPGTSERSWIAAAMHRAAVDAVRRKRTRRQVERRAAEMLRQAEVPSGSAASADDLLALRAAMGELPAESRTAIELRYYEGLPDREVAEVLGAKPNTVTQRIKRSLEAVRRKLAARRSESTLSAAVLFALLGAEGKAQQTVGAPPEIAAWLGELARGTIPVSPAPAVMTPGPWLTLRKGVRRVAKNPLTYVLLAMVGSCVLWIAMREDGGGAEAGKGPEASTSDERLAEAPDRKGPRSSKTAPAAAEAGWSTPRIVKIDGQYNRVIPVCLAVAEKPALTLIAAGIRHGDSGMLVSVSRDRGASWTPMKNVSKHQALGGLVTGGAVHFCAHFGMRGGGGSLGALEYLRVSPAGKELKRVKLMPGKENQRYLGARLLGDGKNLVALSTHDPSLGNAPMNTFALHSADGGKSWSKPVFIEKGIRLGDLADFPPCAFMNGKTAGWFYVAPQRRGDAVEGPGKIPPVTLAISRDAGATWKRQLVPAFKGESDLKLTRVIPLACAASDKHVYLALAAISGKRPGKTKITYYLARSDDLGKTWQEAKPVSPALVPEDPSTYVTLAVSKERVAFGYTEVVGRWTQGQMRAHVSLSENGGTTWFDLHAFDAVEGFSMMPQLAFNEGTGDLHVAAAVTPKGQRTTVVLVRTYGSVPQTGEVTLPKWWREEKRPEPTPEVF